MSNQNDDQAPASKLDIKMMQDQLSIILQLMGTFATKDDLNRLVTKEDLKEFATKDDLQLLRDEIMLHTEQVQSNLTDVIRDSASVTSDRIDNHEKRIHVLEMRI